MRFFLLIDGSSLRLNNKDLISECKWFLHRTYTAWGEKCLLRRNYWRITIIYFICATGCLIVTGK
jgi:hypothetical protein